MVQSYGNCSSARSHTPKGQRAREHILATAEDAFAERGFHGTSMRDLAAAADLPLATLVYHFATQGAALRRRARRDCRAARPRPRDRARPTPRGRSTMDAAAARRCVRARARRLGRPRAAAGAPPPARAARQPVARREGGAAAARAVPHPHDRRSSRRPSRAGVAEADRPRARACCTLVGARQLRRRIAADRRSHRRPGAREAARRPPTSARRSHSRTARLGMEVRRHAR